MADRTGIIDGQRDGYQRGLGGQVRDPRPDLTTAIHAPQYLPMYMAAYEVAYNRGTTERDRILREAALREDRNTMHAINAQERQAERE